MRENRRTKAKAKAAADAGITIEAVGIRHPHLSPGCWHGHHERCTPGKCPFCSVGCHCPCHGFANTTAAGSG